MVNIREVDVEQELRELGASYEFKPNSMSGRTLVIWGPRDPGTGQATKIEVPSNPADRMVDVTFRSEWIFEALQDARLDATDGFKRDYLDHWVRPVDPFGPDHEPERPPDHKAPEPPHRDPIHDEPGEGR